MPTGIGLGLSPNLPDGARGTPWSPGELGLRAWYDAELGQPKYGGPGAYVQLDGTSGDYIYTPDTATVSFSNDIEVVMRVKVTDWSAAAIQTLVGKYVTTSNQRSWKIASNTSAQIIVTCSADGTTTNTATITPSVALPDATWLWIRVRMDLTNGSNSVGSLDTASDTGSNSDVPSSWTANGSATATALAGLFDSTAPLEIGSFQNGTSERFAGRVGRCIVRDGFDGRTVADFNASDCYGPGYLNQGSLPTDGGGARYVPLRGVSGDYVWTADKAALRITGDIEIVARITPDTWLESGDKAICGKWLSATNQRGFALHLSTAGVLKFYWSTAGTATVGGTSTAVVPFAVGQTGWVKATLDVDNGAGGHDLRFFTAPDQATEPTSWTQLGSTVPSPAGAGTTSIFGCSEPLLIGQAQTNLGPNLAGRYQRVIVRSGIGGTTVADFNAANATAFGLPSDGYGNGWLIADPKHHGNWTLGLPKIYDRSGNGVAPATFGAGSNQPQWLPWRGIGSVYLPGSTSDYVGGPNLDLTGDVTARVRLRWNSTMSGFNELVSDRFGATGEFAFRFDGSGLNCLWYESGVAKQVTSSAHGITTEQDVWFGCERINNNGGVYRVRFYKSTAEAPSLTDWSDWTLISSHDGAAVAAPTTSAIQVKVGGATSALTGQVYRAVLTNNGTVVADFVAASCGQSGYTDPLGNAWAVNRGTSGRKAVVQSPVAASARSVILHGTDDYIDVPLAAAPPLGIANSASMLLAARLHATPTSFGRVFSTEDVTNAQFYIGHQTSGQAYTRLSDGVTAADINSVVTWPTTQRGVAVVNVSGRSATGLAVSVNGGAETAADTTAVGDATSPDIGRIGARASSAASYSDMEFEALATRTVTTSGTERGQLTAYYRGGL